MEINQLRNGKKVWATLTINSREIDVVAWVLAWDFTGRVKVKANINCSYGPSVVVFTSIEKLSPRISLLKEDKCNVIKNERGREMNATKCTICEDVIPAAEAQRAESASGKTYTLCADCYQGYQHSNCDLDEWLFEVDHDGIVARHSRYAKTLERILYEEVEVALEGVCFDGRYNPTVTISPGPCRCKLCRTARKKK